MSNPFFQDYTTTFGTIPFSKIENEHYAPAITQGIEDAKAEVDAIVAEGFEAGGHNGRDETTTLTLIPSVKEKITIPIINFYFTAVLQIKILVILRN